MSTPKIGRNDPCSCGSGKKYKQCCQHRDETGAAITPALDTLNTLVQSGLQYHHAGDLRQAESIYRQILQQAPSHPEALQLLGLIAHQVGNNQAAVELIGQAVKIQPSAQMYYNLGIAQQALGDVIAAADSYCMTLALKPGYVEAHCNLGNVLQVQGRLDEAIESYHKALSLSPNLAEPRLNLGNAFKDQGKLDAAIENYKKALAIKPDYADALSNLGSALHLQGEYEASADCCRQALALKPEHAEAHYNLGNALHAQAKYEMAAEHYRKALAIKPNFADAYNNLGNTFKDQCEQAAAVECYQKALAINPGHIVAGTNLGNVLMAQGKLDAAAQSYRNVLALNPNYGDARSGLAMVLQAQGNLDQAVACYRQALEINPALVDAHSNLIFALDLMANADTLTLQAERKKWDAVHAAPLTVTHRAHTNQADPERRLRIGYVSADFREHSAASVFGGMLVQFDRSRFDVHAYSNSQIEDARTRLFQQNVTRWNKIAGLSDQAVADLIRQDQIDILVDLSGHSAGNRLLVFARKPAPIQVTAWGYATGTGMQAMDVFFADPVIVPQEEKSLFTEDIRYLPNVVGYFSARTYPPLNTLPALSAAHITFGSFNRLSKISEQAFQVWGQVLAAIPNSRLILKTSELDDPATREQVAAHFTQAGIDPARITMLGKTSWEQHMSAFHQVDIALDPFPHGGGVTTLEGLMMGVPVITLRWQTIVGRLSASILTTLGLSDWIAETPEQYIEIALQKAQDMSALNTLRLSLRNRLCTSIIGDNAAYAAAVEKEYRQLWREWCGRQAATD